MRKNKEARKEEMGEVEKFREAELNNLKLLLVHKKTQEGKAQ